MQRLLAAIAFLLDGLVAPTVFADASQAGLSFEDRVAAQRAIEEVYWRHRIWPSENSTAKPPLDAVMPDSAIRAKVEDYLAKSTALATLWQRPIAGMQLQAELDRMAQRTRSPRLLNELFDALDRDPLLIAETLGRQVFADRLARSWYTGDDRFHGALEQKALAARDSCADIACVRLLGADYNESSSKSSEIALLQPTPTGQLGTLRETPEAFVITVVLARRADETVIATATWPKRPCDAWWASARPPLAAASEPAAGSFILPAISGDDCTNDSWRPTHYDFFPDPREYDTAVWTGTEMIVWGGEPPTSTGGRYCACPGGGIRDLDADGDGSGNAAISIASCDGATPVGYAANSADCDDADPDIQPGRAESCNLPDDDCDGLVDDGAVGDL